MQRASRAGRGRGEEVMNGVGEVCGALHGGDGIVRRVKMVERCNSSPPPPLSPPHLHMCSPPPVSIIHVVSLRLHLNHIFLLVPKVITRGHTPSHAAVLGHAGIPVCITSAFRERELARRSEMMQGGQGGRRGRTLTLTLTLTLTRW